MTDHRPLPPSVTRRPCIRAGLLLFALAAATVVGRADAPAPISRAEITEAIDWAEQKLAILTRQTLGNNASRTVSYTSTAGVWTVRNTSVWTSGHLVGLLWMLYERTGKEDWLAAASQWTAGMQSRITATDNDTGFQINCSYGLGLTLGGVDSAAYRQAIGDAALELVAQRYNSTIGCLRSWPENHNTPTTMPFEVNIDQLMNLELILYAAAQMERPDLVAICVSHADRSWQELVRPDGSTFHVVEFNAAGEVVRKRTHQGWRDDSTWSRGQAWAVYGQTMLYRYTGEIRFLERAIACLDYFLAATAAQSADGIPYADFDAPVDASNPRDSSAAAIVAAACMELFSHTGEESYRATAARILATLHRAYLTKGTAHQAILAAASEKWGNAEVGAIFGDYYFIEALSRYLDSLPPPEPEPRTEWAGYPVRDGYYADTGALLGEIYVGFAPWVYAFAPGQWLYLPEETVSAAGAWSHWPR
jgi:hypothetical protein